MREIPEALAAHLAGDATTLCHCWKLTRRDGTVMGFTDHDHDLTFADTDFLAASGFEASEWEAENGLAASGSEVAGALSAEAIREADVAAGLYDGAAVETFIVNWQAPAQHLRLSVQAVGEVSRSEGLFRAELRSLFHRLGQVQGRTYGRRCDARFGDGRCGVDLAAWQATGTVGSLHDTGKISAEGLDAFTAGFFRNGSISFTSGPCSGQRVDVDTHTRSSGQVTFHFWLPLSVPPQEGDTFDIVAGCDKSFDMCRNRFSNGLNFRGFPHIPGADFSYSYADGETEHDGSPLFD